MGFPKGRRLLAAVVVAVLGVGLLAVVGYRVLAPAEVETEARKPYPPASTPETGVVGRLPVAPLIVDSRLRVYAAARQVYADQPVDARNRTSPFWSYRRWPAQVSGVVAEGTTVLTHWSDGRLVALDARTGRVAWEGAGPEPAQGWTSRRTGAGAVWDPPGLFSSRDPQGRPVVVVAGAEQLRAYTLAEGRQLWSAETQGCRTPAGSTAAGQLLVVARCAGPGVVEFHDLGTGEVTDRWQPPGATAELSLTPLGCAAHRSRCRGVRTADGSDQGHRGWLVGTGEPVPAPALDPPGTELDGERAVQVTEEGVLGRSPRTGDELWRRADLPPVELLAVQPGLVHLLTRERELITLDPSTGAVRSRFVLRAGRDGVGWDPGQAHAQDGYLAVERLRQPVAPEAEDSRYFLTPEAVILAAT